MNIIELLGICFGLYIVLEVALLLLVGRWIFGSTEEINNHYHINTSIPSDKLTPEQIERMLKQIEMANKR